MDPLIAQFRAKQNESLERLKRQTEDNTQFANEQNLPLVQENISGDYRNQYHQLQDSIRQKLMDEANANYASIGGKPVEYNSFEKMNPNQLNQFINNTDLNFEKNLKDETEKNKLRDIAQQYAQRTSDFGKIKDILKRQNGTY